MEIFWCEAIELLHLQLRLREGERKRAESKEHVGAVQVHLSGSEGIGYFVGSKTRTIAGTLQGQQKVGKFKGSMK